MHCILKVNHSGANATISPQESTLSGKISRTRETEMYGVMKQIVSENKLPPSHPEMRNQIIKKFTKETGLSPQQAKHYYRECVKDVNEFIDAGILIEDIISDNLDTQRQLQDIKDSIECGALETKDPAMGMVAALKGKNDYQKVLSDSIFRYLRNEVDKDKNKILREKIEVENAATTFSVAMQLEGTLEEKTQKAMDILGKHEDILDEAIEGLFEVIDEESSTTKTEENNQ